jgi:SAM-dependent methyltransferase
MNHQDHLALIRDGILSSGVWAELGSGRGAFTQALAELLGPGGTIYSLDRDRGVLQEQARLMAARFPQVRIHYLAADFRDPLELPPLDGLLMANSLHFVRRKEPVLKRLLGHIKAGGRFVLIEYNTDRGTPWVPHPISYPSWELLAKKVGLSATRKIGTYPSRFLGEIYAAMSRFNDSLNT